MKKLWLILWVISGMLCFGQEQTIRNGGASGGGGGTNGVNSFNGRQGNVSFLLSDVPGGTLGNNITGVASYAGTATNAVNATNAPTGVRVADTNLSTSSSSGLMPKLPAGGTGHTFLNDIDGFTAIDLSSASAIGVLAAGRFPALTGDITTPSGSLATTLATVNGNVGTFGDATHVPQVIVNAKGLITGVSQVLISGGGGSQTPWTGNIDGGGFNLTDVGSITFSNKFIGTNYGTGNSMVWDGTNLYLFGGTNIEYAGSGVFTNWLVVSNDVFAHSFQGTVGTTNLAGTIAAANMPALTGDVTSSAGSTATTIASSAVTLAKMANESANTILGNGTGSPAAPQALSTLPTAVVPAFTGDVTTPGGSLATTLATVNGNVGTFGDSTHVAQMIVNAKGLITGVSQVLISGGGGSQTPWTGNIDGGGFNLTDVGSITFSNKFIGTNYGTGNSIVWDGTNLYLFGGTNIQWTGSGVFTNWLVVSNELDVGGAFILSGLETIKYMSTAGVLTNSTGGAVGTSTGIPESWVTSLTTDLANKANSATTITLNGTANQVAVSPSGAQDLTVNRTWTLSTPTAPIWTNATLDGDQFGTNALYIDKTGVTVSNNLNSIKLTNGTVWASGPASFNGQTNRNTTANQIEGTDANNGQISQTLTAWIDAQIGSTRGAVLERGASGWVIISPGASGTFLGGNGVGADPSYQTPAGSGSTIYASGTNTTIDAATTNLDFWSPALAAAYAPVFPFMTNRSHHIDIAFQTPNPTNNDIVVSNAVLSTKVLAFMDIPLSAWFTNNNVVTPLSPAAPLAVTNLSSGWQFANGVTNAIQCAISLPDDWDLSAIRVRTKMSCIGTNSIFTTNAVFRLLTAMAPPQSSYTNQSITFNTVRFTNNCPSGTTMGAAVGTGSVTTDVTPGGTLNSTNTLLLQIYRDGGQVLREATNGVCLVDDVKIYYFRTNQFAMPTPSVPPQ